MTHITAPCGPAPDLPEHEEHRQRHLERIRSSVRNLTDILEGFLSVDKLERGKIEAHASPFELSLFMRDTGEEMEGMIKKKEQTIRYSGVGTIEMVQDRSILRNVLVNLLSNASKYSPQNTFIDLDFLRLNDVVTISVRDYGIGIPQEAQKNMFRKFFRAENAAQVQGTGLGLNIVQQYVQLLGGTITFESKQNEGSTFSVTIPITFSQ